MSILKLTTDDGRQVSVTLDADRLLVRPATAMLPDELETIKGNRDVFLVLVIWLTRGNTAQGNRLSVYLSLWLRALQLMSGARGDLGARPRTPVRRFAGSEGGTREEEHDDS